MNYHDLVLESLIIPTTIKKVIGIEGVVWSAKELVCWDGKNKVGEIDVLIYTGRVYHRPYHIIEYKRSYDKKKKALKQLYNSTGFMRKVLNAGIYRCFVYGLLDELRAEYIGAQPIKQG